MGGTQSVVIVAIVILAVVFAAALITVVLLCYRERRRKQRDFLGQAQPSNRPDESLVDNSPDLPQETPGSGVELASVSGLSGQYMDKILEDEDWVMDATGLAPHCLDILRTCHHLTNKLVAMTMNGNNEQLISPETMTDLVATAKRIGPRVDEVVRALYPPLDPRLLEARCTALVLSVSHLVLITKNACRLSGVLDWIDQSLADVEDHLRVLREASVNYDSWLDQSTNRQQAESEADSDAPVLLPASGVRITHGPGSVAGGWQGGGAVGGRGIPSISGQVSFQQTVSGGSIGISAGGMGVSNSSFHDDTSAA